MRGAAPRSRPASTAPARAGHCRTPPEHVGDVLQVCRAAPKSRGRAIRLVAVLRHSYALTLGALYFRSDAHGSPPVLQARCSRAVYYLSDFAGFIGRCQPSTVTCRARARVSLPATTECVTVEPAAIVAPAPTVMGATSTLLEPVCTSSPMTVLCLLAPS